MNEFKILKCQILTGVVKGYLNVIILFIPYFFFKQETSSLKLKDDTHREFGKSICETLISLKAVVDEGDACDIPVEPISIFSKYLEKKHKGIEEHNIITLPQTDALDVSATNGTEPSVMSCADILKYVKLDPDHGRKLTLDNIDIHQATHDMTEEHLNPDVHYCTLMATENRVSDDKPICTLDDLKNATFCPSKYEHIKQREDYIALVGKIMVNSIPCLNSLKDAATYHIPHQYSKEMTTSTETVSRFLDVRYACL